MIPIIVGALAFITALVSVALQIREQRRSHKITQAELERVTQYEADYKSRKDFLDSVIAELERERKRNTELVNAMDALQKRHREALDRADELLGALAKSERIIASLQFQIERLTKQ